MAADILGYPVVPTLDSEAGALGAAFQAMWCWYNEKKGKTSIKSITERYVNLDTDHRCEPEIKNMSVYNETFNRYTAVNDALRPLY